MVATSAFVAADWLQQNPNGSIWVVFLIGGLVGGLLGAFNALLVTGFRIPAIVATLGTLAMYRGWSHCAGRWQADLSDGVT